MSSPGSDVTCRAGGALYAAIRQSFPAQHKLAASCEAISCARHRRYPRLILTAFTTRLSCHSPVAFSAGKLVDRMQHEHCRAARIRQCGLSGESGLSRALGALIPPGNNDDVGNTRCHIARHRQVAASATLAAVITCRYRQDGGGASPVLFIRGEAYQCPLP